MICFVKEYLKEHVPEAGVRMDRLGNLYITKGDPEGGYPTLACHLDQVQLLHSTDFEVVLDGDTLYGWSASRQEREGLGADDKNGLWICLCCLEQCLRLKVFMAIGEEKGCIGSNRAEMGFFSDSLFVLEPDCKGGEEAHTVLRGIPCASEEFIEELGTKYDIREIAFDRWGAVQMSQNLEGAGFTVVPFGQGYASMSPPTKELLKLVLEERIAHGGHPVLRWMVDNVTVRTDPAGNIKPDKEKSTEKIDGAVALIMALDRAIRHENDGLSVYDERGLLFV